MGAIDAENRITFEIDAPEPEASFSLEEFDHYCELFDVLLAKIEIEDRVRVEGACPESFMGSAAHRSNVEGYLNEFDRHEIGVMRARYGISGWPCSDDSLKVGGESTRYGGPLADRHPPGTLLGSLGDADRRDV